MEILIGLVIIGAFAVKWMFIGWLFNLFVGALQGLGRIGTEPTATGVETEEAVVEEEEGVDIDVLHEILDSVESNDDDNVIDFSTRKRIKDIRNELNSLAE